MNNADSINMLIADDEYAIRTGLASLPWPEQGITLIFAACDGLEALEATKKHRIDILLTDICMPGLSGVELGELALGSNPEMKIIFLTGYDDFEFARRAVTMHAHDYILKPTSPKTVISCVLEAKKKIQERNLRESSRVQLENDIKNLSVLVEAGDLLKGGLETEIREDSIDDIVRYISEHYSDQLTLPSLAEHFHYNAVYLCRYIKAKSGFTFTEILSNIRMYHAARLLKGTTLKNGEICERIGLFDERYFSQVFKKIYGMTPNGYRKEKEAYPRAVNIIDFLNTYL